MTCGCAPPPPLQVCWQAAVPALRRQALSDMWLCGNAAALGHGGLPMRYPHQQDLMAMVDEHLTQVNVCQGGGGAWGRRRVLLPYLGCVQHLKLPLPPLFPFSGAVSPACIDLTPLEQTSPPLCLTYPSWSPPPLRPRLPRRQPQPRPGEEGPSGCRPRHKRNQRLPPRCPCTSSCPHPRVRERPSLRVSGWGEEREGDSGEEDGTWGSALCA